jgi:hypothetical protein
MVYNSVNKGSARHISRGLTSLRRSVLAEQQIINVFWKSKENIGNIWELGDFTGNFGTMIAQTLFVNFLILLAWFRKIIRAGQTNNYPLIQWINT